MTKEQALASGLEIITVGDITGEITNSYDYGLKYHITNRNMCVKIKHMAKSDKNIKLSEGLYRATNGACHFLFIFDKYLSDLLGKPHKIKMNSYKKEGHITCKDCENTFPATSEYFPKSSHQKYGLRNLCKPCKAKQDKKYIEDNQDKVKETRKNSYQKNKKAWNKPLNKEQKERKRIYDKLYNQKNKEKQYIRHKERLATEPLYKLTTILRSHVKVVFNTNKMKKIDKTFNYTGCTREELLEHFNSGKYTMEDYITNKKGNIKFHMDHIIPTKYFLKKMKLDKEGNVTPETAPWLYKWWNWRNLRIWPALDNLSKGAEIDKKLIKKHGIEDLLTL